MISTTCGSKVRLAKGDLLAHVTVPIAGNFTLLPTASIICLILVETIRMTKEAHPQYYIFSPPNAFRVPVPFAVLHESHRAFVFPVARKSHHLVNNCDRENKP